VLIQRLRHVTFRHDSYGWLSLDIRSLLPNALASLTGSLRTYSRALVDLLLETLAIVCL
jgi:hypothetical protein